MTGLSHITVVVPLYNAELYIEETLRSVLKQSFKEFKLIVVNDGSTDRSAYIVEKIKDARIELINIENAGVSNARNIGIQACQTKYIAFLDADDLWSEDKLEEQFNALESNSRLDFVFSDIQCIDEHSDLISRTLIGTDKDMLKHLLLWDRNVIPNPCSNLLMKTSVARDLLFDLSFSTAADQDFAFRLCAQYTGCHVKKIHVFYRVLAQSMSRNIAIMQKDHIRVYQKADHLDLFYSKRFKNQCFSNLYLILAGSWYKNGKKPIKAFYFMLKSLVVYPKNLKKILQKF